MKLFRLKSPGGLENLTLFHEDSSLPGPGEVLVRIRACALNFRDLMLVKGMPPVADGRIPLSDGAGDVLAVGAHVTSLKVGDSVVSTFYPYWSGGEMTSATRRDIPGETFDGFASDHVCMPAQAFTKAPRSYSHSEAATLTCTGVTAWKALIVHGQVKPGDIVLIQGTGSVSLFALQFAKSAGARVIATSSSDEKLHRLKQLGADDLINYRTDPEWGRKARDLTDGRGVDHVVDVGGPTTLAQSMAACRTGGHIAVVGVLGGFSTEVFIPAIFSNQLRLTGVSIGSREDQENMIRAIESNDLKPVVDRCFPFEDFVPALTYFESHQHIGKVCLET